MFTVPITSANLRQCNNKQNQVGFLLVVDLDYNGSLTKNANNCMSICLPHSVMHQAGKQ